MVLDLLQRIIYKFKKPITRLDEEMLWYKHRNKCRSVEDIDFDGRFLFRPHIDLNTLIGLMST
jgi:hypothetical protein